MFVSLKSRLIGSVHIPCLFLVLLLCAPCGFRTDAVKRCRHPGHLSKTHGAVVANATVTAHNARTGFSRSATTNDEGSIASSTCHPAIMK
jgi:hypothetical protein